MNFNSASSLKQQLGGRHVILIPSSLKQQLGGRHVILIPSSLTQQLGGRHVILIPSSLTQQLGGRHVILIPSSLTQQLGGRHVILIPTSLSSYSLKPCTQWRSNQYQINSLWFDLTRARSHDLSHFTWCKHANHYINDVVYCIVKLCTIEKT